jgi:hypothetical protein
VRHGYSTAVGPEPYIAMAGRGRVAGAGCSFPSGMIFALQPGRQPAIIAITPAGRASRFTSLPATAAPGGITFDTSGRFGHRLVVTARNPGDLLVATEGGARTIVVRCATTCTVRYIAAGPAITHAEGHIVFTRPG